MGDRAAQAKMRSGTRKILSASQKAEKVQAPHQVFKVKGLDPKP